MNEKSSCPVLRGRDGGNTILLLDHLAAVTTTTGKALIVTGREIRSLKRQRAKQLVYLARKQNRCQKYSRRWKKLQRAKHKQCCRAERRIRDLRHKATLQVIAFCMKRRVGTLFIGNPQGVRQENRGRHHNQRMAAWEYGKDIDYLTHKAKAAHIWCFTGSERGTSSQCPCCGRRYKPKNRNWACRACGFRGHRDLVGSVSQQINHRLQSGSLRREATLLMLPRSPLPFRGRECHNIVPACHRVQNTFRLDCLTCSTSLDLIHLG